MNQSVITTSLTISHIDYSPSGDVNMMYCQASDHHDLSFRAGQFMLLAAEIDGTIIKRSYSIATTPQLLSEQWIIWFSIKRVEGWVFSTRATHTAQPWDTLTMTGPLGKMVDHGEVDNYLLISAGSWLSPIYAIYHSLLTSSRSVRIANIFGERYFSHILPCVHHDWVENVWSMLLWNSPHLEQQWIPEKVDPILTPSCNFSWSIYSQCFLSADEHEWYNIGRVQLWIANACDRLATTDIRVFICGAPAMVDEVRGLLIAEYRIDPTYIHFEKY